MGMVNRSRQSEDLRIEIISVAHARVSVQDFSELSNRTRTNEGNMGKKGGVLEI